MLEGRSSFIFSVETLLKLSDNSLTELTQELFVSSLFAYHYLAASFLFGSVTGTHQCVWILFFSPFSASLILNLPCHTKWLAPKTYVSFSNNEKQNQSHHVFMIFPMLWASLYKWLLGIIVIVSLRCLLLLRLVRANCLIWYLGFSTVIWKLL